VAVGFIGGGNGVSGENMKNKLIDNILYIK
jgi:hypothetical protein